MSDHRGSADLFLLAPTWKGRGLALLRFLAFVVLFCVFTVALVLLFWLLLWLWHVDPRTQLETSLAMQVAAEGLGALAATAVMARAGGRRLGEFGFGGSGRWRKLLIGAAGGLAVLALMLLVLRLAHAFTLEPASDRVSATMLNAVFYALLMLGVAFSEESFSRGYALTALSQSISFWPAAIVLGGVFGLMHAANSGETAIGVASAALLGLLLAYSFRRTRSLWFALGFHAGWDYAESFVFGVPNSGLTLPGSLFQGRFDGPSWLTGGSAGPEGSVLILLVFGAIVLIIEKISRAADSDDPDAPAAAGLAMTSDWR
jgi:uncharacterized protein